MPAPARRSPRSDGEPEDRRDVLGDDAGEKIVAACEVLGERRLDPPPAVELTGPKHVPAFDAKFREIDDEPAPAVVGETVTLDVAGIVDSVQTEVEGEGDSWRVAIDGYDNVDGDEFRLEIQ